MIPRLVHSGFALLFVFLVWVSGAYADGVRSSWVLRSDWGARAPKSNVTLPDKISDFSLGKLRGIVIHQTESPSTWTMKRLETYFRDDLSGPRFRDVAYHFVIRQESAKGPWKVYEGRDGSASSQKKLGMHAMDNNPSNIGIAVMGNFPSGSSSVLPEDLKKTIRELVAEILKENPEVKFLWGHGELKTLRRGSDHIPKDQWSAGHTNCPGPPLLQVVQDLRKEHRLAGGDPRTEITPIKKEVRVNLKMMGAPVGIRLRYKDYGENAGLSFAEAELERESAAQVQNRVESYQGVAAGKFAANFQALLWRYPAKKKGLDNPESSITPELFLISAMNFGKFSADLPQTESAPGTMDSISAGEFDRGNISEWIRAKVEHLAITISAKQLSELEHYSFLQDSHFANAAEIRCQGFSAQNSYVSLMQLTGLWPGEVARVIANCGVSEQTRFKEPQIIAQQNVSKR